MYRLLFLSLSPFWLSGCAYLTTYNKDLGNPGQGVAIDAKQRVVLFNRIKDKDNKETLRACAEPSPDALSALSASIGASFFSAASTKQLAGALGETSASIGLRTTSIQLMRDAMYRVCEAYISDGIDGPTYADLQAHAQTLVVGLLAIEQLTGAVQAQQVAITSSSSSGAGGTDIAKEADELTQAKKSTLEQKTKLETAMMAQMDADKIRDQNLADIKAGKFDPKFAKSDLDKLESAQNELDKKSKDLKAAAEKEAKLLEIAEASEKIYQTNFDLARNRVRSSTSGDSRWGQTTRGAMSEATAQQMAKSVEAIVNRVTETSIESQTQKCLNYYMRSETSTNKPQIDTLCLNAALKEQTQIAADRASRGAPVSPVLEQFRSEIIRQQSRPTAPAPAPAPATPSGAASGTRP